MPLEEVPCSSPRPNSQRAHSIVCPLENYVLNVHRFLGPNFANVRTAVSCGWIASDDAHGHVVFPSRLQARIVAIMSKRLACVISARTRSFNRPLQGTVEAGETFICGKAARSAFAALAQLPTQPCTEHRRHGPVRGFDHWPRPALRPGHRPAGRRQLVWINVTPSPTAEWIAHQITEAFP